MPYDYAVAGSTPTTPPYDPAWRNARTCEIQNLHPANCDLQTVVVTPQHHSKQPPSTSSNKSHTNQTWCRRVFAQTRMAICARMATYGKTYYWPGPAEKASGTMLLVHKPSIDKQMITDCDLTRGFEHRAKCRMTTPCPAPPQHHNLTTQPGGMRVTLKQMSTSSQLRPANRCNTAAKPLETTAI